MIASFNSYLLQRDVKKYLGRTARYLVQLQLQSELTCYVQEITMQNGLAV
jgi:hypothetical protein